MAASLPRRSGRYYEEKYTQFIIKKKSVYVLFYFILFSRNCGGTIAGSGSGFWAEVGALPFWSILTIWASEAFWNFRVLAVFPVYRNAQNAKIENVSDTK